MVAIKSLFLAAAAALAVTAQYEPTGNAAEAKAYWDNALSASTTLSESTAISSRSLRIEGRTADTDPYRNRVCVAPYTTPRALTTCNRNNCFRSFLNAREGSEGRHCPRTAFGLCCAWNFAPPFFRYWAIQSGLVFSVAPYAKNCKSDGDSSLDVLSKIDDVCGCTLNHEVKVESNSDYITATC